MQDPRWYRYFAEGTTKGMDYAQAGAYADRKMRGGIVIPVGINRTKQPGKLLYGIAQAWARLRGKEDTQA